MYITIADYNAIYDGMDEKAFNRLAFDACRMVENYTTGVDGVKKLKEHFPTDDDAVQAVKRCICKLIYTMSQIETAEKAVNQGRGYTETENGIRGKIIAAVSAGNESISYSAGGGNTATLIDKALADKAVQNKLFSDTVREYLSGVTDANGVNLLYAGVYPRV